MTADLGEFVECPCDKGHQVLVNDGDGGVYPCLACRAEAAEAALAAERAAHAALRAKVEEWALDAERKAEDSRRVTIAYEHVPGREMLVQHNHDLVRQFEGQARRFRAALPEQEEAALAAEREAHAALRDEAEALRASVADAWDEGYRYGRILQAESMAGDAEDIGAPLQVRNWLKNSVPSLRRNLDCVRFRDNPYRAALSEQGSTERGAS